jgi:hypothetical protein
VSNKIIIFPHVGIYGGAGIYIRNLSESLSGFLPVFAGTYASEYGAEESLSKHDCINKIHFPNYVGVKSLTKLYVMLLSSIRLLYLTVMGKDRVNKQNTNVIILTSGIQLLLFYYLKKKYPNAHFVLLVQENWLLSNFFLGAISRKLLNRVDLVVSITDSWKAYANQYGVDSCILKNTFSVSTAPVSASKAKYDLLYFGGTQKIKGYASLIHFFQEYSRKSKIQVAILGEVSLKKKLEIDTINANIENGSGLFVLGFITDTAPIIDESKIVFLPITDSHFCRPAIEAGLRRKTFIIRALDGISDFAIPENNCAKFTSTKDLIDKYNRLSRDVDYLKKLSENNYKFSIEFVKNQTENVVFYNYIKERVKQL